MVSQMEVITAIYHRSGCCFALGSGTALKMTPCWYGERDSNPQKTGFEPAASANCAIPAGTGLYSPERIRIEIGRMSTTQAPMMAVKAISLPVMGWGSTTGLHIHLL